MVLERLDDGAAVSVSWIFPDGDVSWRVVDSRTPTSDRYLIRLCGVRVSNGARLRLHVLATARPCPRCGRAANGCPECS